MIEDCIQLALDVHTGQRDKGGAAYVLHPLHLMDQFTDETSKCVAVLHDVIEDSPTSEHAWLCEHIKTIAGDVVLGAVIALTRGKDEAWDDYIQRVKENPIARRVKSADLQHNMDLTRLPSPSNKDIKRRDRYAAAQENLWI